MLLLYYTSMRLRVGTLACSSRIAVRCSMVSEHSWLTLHTKSHELVQVAKVQRQQEKISSTYRSIIYHKHLYVIRCRVHEMTLSRGCRGSSTAEEGLQSALMHVVSMTRHLTCLELWQHIHSTRWRNGDRFQWDCRRMA